MVTGWSVSTSGPPIPLSLGALAQSPQPLCPPPSSLSEQSQPGPHAAQAAGESHDQVDQGECRQFPSASEPAFCLSAQVLDLVGLGILFPQLCKRRVLLSALDKNHMAQGSGNNSHATTQ